MHVAAGVNQQRPGPVIFAHILFSFYFIYLFFTLDVPSNPVGGGSSAGELEKTEEESTSGVSSVDSGLRPDPCLFALQNLGARMPYFANHGVVNDVRDLYLQIHELEEENRRCVYLH